MASSIGAAQVGFEIRRPDTGRLHIVPDHSYVDELVIPEISAQRADSFVRIEENQRYTIGCLDERHPTTESAAKIRQDLKAQGHVYYRVGGAGFGVARLAGVMIAADAGPEALEMCYERAGGSFSGFVKYVKGRVEDKNKVILTGHSAQKNERRSAHFDHRSCECLGCIYAHKIGAVTHLQRRGGEIYTLGEVEQTALFGSADLLEPVARANEDVMKILFKEGGAKYSVGRKVIRGAHLPGMILEGEHYSIRHDEVAANLNFHPDKISETYYANHHAKAPFYNVDATAVVTWIMRAFSGFNLSPETGLAVVEHDFRAARHALAGLEGLGAKEFPVQRYGDARIALNALKKL